MPCSRLLSNQQKDRGYAWVVVFLAFCCHTVVWGLIYTIGIWTSTFEEAFGASKAVASTIGSGLTGINYIAGRFFFTKQSDLPRDRILVFYWQIISFLVSHFLADLIGEANQSKLVFLNASRSKLAFISPYVIVVVLQ